MRDWGQQPRWGLRKSGVGRTKSQRDRDSEIKYQLLGPLLCLDLSQKKTTKAGTCHKVGASCWVNAKATVPYLRWRPGIKRRLWGLRVSAFWVTLSGDCRIRKPPAGISQLSATTRGHPGNWRCYNWAWCCRGRKSVIQNLSHPRARDTIRPQKL